MQWHVLSPSIPHTLPELETVLLENRHLTKATEQKEFFQPKSPFEITLTDVGIDELEMKKAVERIQQAKNKQEDVLIFGDYDADGVCSTATLWEALKSVGVVARPFIPHREKHGYGLSMRSLAAIVAEKTPDLLITVDNGIVAHEAFAELRRMGVSTILTDHHQPESELPAADIILHTPQVCGTGVAWFFARSLNAAAAEKSLDLAAIATVTDQMPLLKINRSLVTHGLGALRQTERVGLQLLIERANIDPTKLDANSINYAIGPRINAMGRIKHGMDALRLICTKNIERAELLVQELQSTNESRQEMTSDMIEQAVTQAQTWESEHLIIVASTEYHEGVIGLLAGKLMEAYYKPAIVIALGENVAKASARSVQGVNIIDLIRLVKEDLLEAGGHPMAAGFGFLPEKLDIIKEKLLLIAREQISVDLLEPSIDVDCVLPFEFATLQTCTALQKFAPFGQGNREPIFALNSMKVLAAEAMGREGKHLRMSIIDAATQANRPQAVNAIAWNKGSEVEKLHRESVVNLAGTLQCNEWKKRKNVQLLIKNIKYIDEV